MPSVGLNRLQIITGLSDEGLRQYERALRIDGRHEQALLDAARTYYEKGDRGKAEEYVMRFVCDDLYGRLLISFLYYLFFLFDPLKGGKGGGHAEGPSSTGNILL